MTVSPERWTGMYLTSGTSGLGQEVYGHTVSDTYYYAHAWATGLYWSGVRKGQRYYNLMPASVGQLCGPDSFTRGVLLLGSNCVQTGVLSAQGKLQMMQRFSPTHIYTVPAYLQRMEISCEDMFGKPPRDVFPGVESILIGTEAYTPEWAEKMADLWGCRIYEIYGSTQQGTALCFTCEQGVTDGGRHTYLHHLEHLTYVEILDRVTREPVEPGQEGEIVITTLARDVSAVIRFATDDRAFYYPHSACSCGRPFNSVLAGSISRYDDMIKIKAMNVWPSAVDAVVFAFPSVAEYQGRVFITEQGQEKVLLRVELRDQVPVGDRQSVMGEMSKLLQLRVGVTMDVVEAAEPLPRFDFKVRRWTDERMKGRERILFDRG
jgi:phenylacetate-CoA ligase